MASPRNSGIRVMIEIPVQAVLQCWKEESMGRIGGSREREREEREGE